MEDRKPKLSGIIAPPVFRERDLNLQVRLDTCKDGVYIDYTGKKSYTFGLMKQGVGFGITDIDITVNASLQPLVEITFKDLYGNTLFGTQRVSQVKNRQPYAFNGDVAELDYSVIFDWPPPKFYFTFKGYLGRPVTWVLNLKKTDTRFNAADQSFELKASFVPNHWGFFADMPLIYLLAIKSLKEGRTSGVDNNQERDELRDNTLYDLIKIGKKVDVSKGETTKEFDVLDKQVSSALSNLDSAISSSKVIKFDSKVTGEVNGKFIDEFRNFKVIKPPISNSNNNNNSDYYEKYRASFTRTDEIQKLNQFLVQECLKFEGDNDFNSTPPSFDPTTFVLDPKKYDPKINLLRENLENINEAIKSSFFTKNIAQLEKITISRILRKIAGDGGYLLGSILEAGFLLKPGAGKDNQASNASGEVFTSDDIFKQRVENDNIIGTGFPMCIKDGKEVPATKTNLGTDIKVDEYEMAFVDKFIRAIAEGVARNRLSDSELNENEDSTLKKRINNAEMIQDNPYKPSYISIASNILERSGIISFVTRSNDPNFPGDYGTSAGFDNDSIDNVTALAQADMQNITKGIITQLFDDDINRLKDFCLFFRSIFNKDGSVNDDEYPGFSTYLGGLNDRIDPRLKNIPVQLSEDKTKTIGQFFDEDVKQLLNSSQSQSSINEVSDINNDLSGGFDNTYQLRRIVNNNIPYLIAKNENDQEYSDDNNFTYEAVSFVAPEIRNDSGYFMVRFEGSDAQKALGVNNGPSDGNPSDPDDIGFFDLDAAEPEGIVPITTLADSEGEVLERVSYYNDHYVKNGTMYDFNKMKSSLSSFRNKSSSVEVFEVFDTDPGFAINSSGQTTFNGELVNRKEGSENIYIYNKITFGEFEYNNPITEDNTNSNYKGGPGLTVSRDDILNFVGEGSNQNSDLPSGGYAFTIFYQAKENDLVWAPFLEDDYNESENQRACLRAMCDSLYDKLTLEESDRREAVGGILANAQESRDLIYKQFHILFNQWNILAFEAQKFTISDDKNNSDKKEDGEVESNKGEELTLYNKGFNNLCRPKGEFVDLPTAMENMYYASHKNVTSPNDKQGIPGDSTFRYDFPMNNISKDDATRVNVANSIINIDSLYKPKANTTLLNAIQQICQKNNFIFIPIPGNAEYRNVSEIYTPRPETARIQVRNYFHVLFAPTPERRVYGNKGTQSENNRGDNTDANAINVDCIEFKFGSIDNKVVKNINVSTDENKITAESIVNLQRLTDNENRNKTVSTDCSMLPVLEGRSYKASVEMIGNSQVFPMQYFYIPRMPLFGGLYQIMSVNHSIVPNDMTTKVEGIKILSVNNQYGGQEPVTTDGIKAEYNLANIETPNQDT